MRSRDRLSLYAGSLALVLSVLCVGSALRWTQAVVALLVAIALGFQLKARRRPAGPTPIVIGLGIALGGTLIQLMPLPGGLRDMFDSTGDSLRTDGSLIADTAPWEATTLDPSGTLRAACFLMVLLGVALLAARIINAERGRFLLLGGVALTCGLAAIVTAIHTLFGIESLFGIYAPAHASPPILGPLLNSNHLGSLCAFGAVLSLGLAFHHQQSVPMRVGWILNLVLCTLISLATASRGAAVALVIGAIVTTSLLAARHFSGDVERRRRRTVLSDLPIGVVVIFGLGLAIFSSAGKVADQLDRTSLTELDQPASKFAAWRSSVELIEEAPLLGVGRGAFEPAFTRVHEASSQVTFSHLENEYLQAVVEWGLPISIALALVAGWFAFLALRRWNEGPLAAAALGALAAIAFQSSVDFAVELLGVAIPVVIVASTLVRAPLVVNGARRRRLLGLRLASIAGLLAAASLLVTPRTRSIQEDHDQMARYTIDELRDSIERHPLDYLAFGLMASRLAASSDGRSISFLNHALRLHPSHVGLHRLAARILILSKRPQQAAVEMALAMKGSTTPHALLIDIVAWFPDVNDAANAIPTDYGKPTLLLRSLGQLRREDISLRWLERVIETPQISTDQIDRLYTLATDKREWKIAERAARARIKVFNTNTSRLMLARAQFKLGEHAQVLTTLANVPHWRGRIDEQSEAWLLVCDVALEARRWDEALQCLHRLDASGILVGGRRASILSRTKRIDDERARESRQQALEALERSLKKSQ